MNALEAHLSAREYREFSPPIAEPAADSWDAPGPPQPPAPKPAPKPKPKPGRGWRTMRRVDLRVRRPGAHDSDEDCYLKSPFPDSDEDCYLKSLFPYSDEDCCLKSLFPDTNFEARCRLRSRLAYLQGWQNRIEMEMLRQASRIASGLPPLELGPLNREHGDDSIERDFYDCEDERKDLMLAWTSRNPMRWVVEPLNPWYPPELPETFPPGVECQFEKEARRYDKGRKPLLAARRRLGRALLRRHLRRAILMRAIALYWQEQTQRALCAPGGAGRAADTASFESEFV